MSTVPPPPTDPGPGTAPAPAWDVAKLFQDQGTWSESDYLSLTTNRLVEYVEGRVEVLPMPTVGHQRISLFLVKALLAFLAGGRGGDVLYAPLRVRTVAGRYREPDLVFIEGGGAARGPELYIEAPALAMEIVSPDDPKRDLVVKREEYARAGILEYWIVDPVAERITVLALPEGGAEYEVHGEFGRGEQATSRLLAGFAVDVAAALDARG